MNAQALERYRELPVPDTTEEHWRFTDLRGFDPDSFTANGAASVARPESMLEIDVAEVRAELEAKGVEFSGDILDTGVCHMAFFTDPDGNDLMLHHRYAPRS